MRCHGRTRGLLARLLVALSIGSALSCAPAGATSPDSWPEVRTMADCFERVARTPLSGLPGPQPLAPLAANGAGPVCNVPLMGGEHAS